MKQAVWFWVHSPESSWIHVSEGIIYFIKEEKILQEWLRSNEWQIVLEKLMRVAEILDGGGKIIFLPLDRLRWVGYGVICFIGS